MSKFIKKVLIDRSSEGAVSLFVVIFAAFLFVAVTVGFTVLMVSDQNRATDYDLAQSARDSAEAGIEEAKRVLAQLEQCNQRDMNSVSVEERLNCDTIQVAVNSGSCDTVRAAQGMASAEETLVAKNTTGPDTYLEQAFTCAKISPDTPSYEGRLDGESDMRVVPIRAVGEVSKVRVSWTRSEGSLPTPDAKISPSWNSVGREISGSSSTIWSESPPILPSKADWNSYGSVMRVGSFQYSSGVMNLAEIDNSSRTAFLYPTTNGAGGINDFSMDGVDKHTNPQFDGVDDLNRIVLEDEGNIAQNIRCDTPVAGNAGSYLCSATFTLAEPITSFTGNTRTYLTLSSIYNSTAFKVELIGGDGNVVLFQNVQPEVDVTGRANNVLRRLVARVESSDASTAPYPRAALGTNRSICKAYMITDSADEFTDLRDASNCPDVKSPETP